MGLYFPECLDKPAAFLFDIPQSQSDLCGKLDDIARYIGYGCTWDCLELFWQVA